MKRLSALLLALVLILTSMPTASFAHNNNNNGNNNGNNIPIELYDADDSENTVSIYAEEGTYVGLDAQIKEEQTTTDDDSSGTGSSGDGIYPNNPYNCSNGNIRVFIDNVAGRSYIDVNYNGRDLDTIRGSRQVVLYVNRTDILKVTTHDDPNYYGDFSSWLISSGYAWDYVNSSSFTVDLSPWSYHQYGYIYLTPWYGSGSSEPDYNITYELKKDSHSAFGINPQNGRVFVKDSDALKNERNEYVTVRVKVKRNNKAHQSDFTIRLQDIREEVVARPDVGEIQPDQIDVVYASDHDNNVFMINLENKTTSQVSDTNYRWFDIANDHSTVLYGVVSNGNLYKNILDPSKTSLSDIGNVRQSGRGVINSLTVDDYGNMYFVDNAVLKYYNVFSDDSNNRIQRVMDVGNQSLGDLVFHNNKLYYAAFKTNQSKGNQGYGVLVEINTELGTTREIGNIPNTTYGLASVNGSLYLLHNKTVSKFDFDKAAADPNLTTTPYEAYMNIGANAGNIFGSAQGDAVATGNVIENDDGDFDAVVKSVDDTSVVTNGDYTFIQGYYGILLIKPDGTYIYVMDSQSQAVKDLFKNETLTETFTYVTGYEGFSDDSVSTLKFTINAYSDAKEKTGLHLDAYDLDGNGEVDENVTEGQSVPEWHDSVGHDNVAVAQGGTTPKLDLDGIYGHRAVDFGGYAYGMNIARQSEVNYDKFPQKTIGTVFKTGDNVSGVQYIFEEGGGWRGYNFVIAPNPENDNKATLYAMVYNNHEWTWPNYYKPIALTTVEPDTVYFAFMAHDSTVGNGTFRAFYNGNFTDIQETEILLNIEEQEPHPDPGGVGWYNSDTVFPHTKTSQSARNKNPKGDKPFDGLIGEIISWNRALTFAEIQELNGELMTKWKPVSVDAVKNIKTVQSGADIHVTWSPVAGIDTYDVIFSLDNTISSDDIVQQTSDKNLTYTMPSELQGQDEVYVFVRYKRESNFSDDAYVLHDIYGKPQDFTHTSIEEGKTLFRFAPEEGKAYAVVADGHVYSVPSSKGYVVLNSDQISDPETAELYETAIQDGQPSYELGHGVKADGPTEKALDRVKGLKAVLNGENIALNWNSFSGATSYQILAGSDTENMVSLDAVNRTSLSITLNKIKETIEDVTDSVFVYFKVRATVEYGDSGESGYGYSGYSETAAVMTPAYNESVDDAEKAVDEAQEGPGDNGLYDVGEYPEEAIDDLEDAIEKAKQAKEDYEDGKITEEELEDAYEELEQAKDDFESSKITESNRISISVVDDSGQPLPDTLVVGEGSLKIVNGAIVVYGPAGYQTDLNLTIDGYVLEGSEAYNILFSESPQNYQLQYRSDNRIIIRQVSGETGELLGTFVVNGNAGDVKVIGLDQVANYKPYKSPGNEGSNSGASLIDSMTLTFTNEEQIISVMYRENDSTPGNIDKTDWKQTALENIIKYAEENNIPWASNSAYDKDDATSGTNTSTSREHTDFLNILGNALNDADKKYADERFVEDYLNDINNNISEVGDYDELIEMLKKYYNELETAIEDTDVILDQIGDVETGPVEDKTDADYKFYEPGQYDKDLYEKLLEELEKSKQMEDSGASGPEKDAQAQALRDALEAFENSLVTENNKVLIQFKMMIDGSLADVTVDGLTSALRYGPSGKSVTIASPFDIRPFSPNGYNSPFEDNRYTPQNGSFTVTFGDTPKNQSLVFVPTELYQLYLDATASHNAAVEGPNDDGFYSVGQYIEGAKAALDAVLQNTLVVLDDVNATDQESAAAKSMLESAIESFESKRITENDRVDIISISGETGETLHTKTVYGPAGLTKTVELESIDHYQPYEEPEDKSLDSNGQPNVYTNIEISFTGNRETYHVMYREDGQNGVPASDKTDWEDTALDSIKKYEDENEIHWKENSSYDADDAATGKSKSERKEYEDFLNILGNALKGDDDKYADEDFVDDYVNDIENDVTPIDSYEDLVDMLKKYFVEISDAFYSDNPGSGQNNEKLDTTKAIFYEDPIDTSVVFRVKEEGVSDPEFTFELIGNQYLSYDYPRIELYKLRDGDDPDDDPAVLNNGIRQSSNTEISSIFDTSTGEYGYKIVVKPVNSTFNKGDIYYVRVITKITVNHESPFYSEAIEDASSMTEQHKLAVNKVVDMYNENSSRGEDFVIQKKSSNGTLVDIQTIDSDDLLFALHVIHDSENGDILITDGLKITTRADWLVDGKPKASADKVASLEFRVEKVPVYPDFVE